MGSKIDKTKIGNWVEGDTFAYKIENCEFSEYNGQYLIFIHTIFPNWEKYRVVKSFRVKITKDKKIPSTEEEINNLEYVKIVYKTYNPSFLLFEEDSKEYFPDEYGFLYQYSFKIYIKKYFVPETFFYIGNYQIEVPLMEYIGRTSFDGVALYFFYQLLEIIESYKLYNLKENDIFTPEGNIEMKQLAKQYDQNDREGRKFMELIRGPHGEEVLASMGIFPDEKPKRNSLTYVGSEKEDPYKTIKRNERNQKKKN